MLTLNDLHLAFAGTPTGLTFIIAAIAAAAFYRVVTMAAGAVARRQHRNDIPASNATFQRSPYARHSRSH